MKNYITILILIVLPVCSLFAQKTVKYSGLKGKIKYIRDVKYDAKKIYGDIVPAKRAIDANKTDFNNDGYRSRFESYNSNGDTIYIYEPKYKKGEIIATTYKRENQISARKLIRKSGNVYEWEWYSSKDSIAEKVIIERNFDKRNLYEKVTIRNETDSSKNEMTETWFDKAMNHIEEKYYLADSMTHWRKMKYNAKNELTELSYTTGDEEMVYNYTYSLYDEKGNWTKQVTYFGGEPEEVVIRTIIYK